MIALSLKKIANITGGKLISADDSLIINAISTDSRAISKGSLFVALKGEVFDGHHYVTQAINQGAAALLVSDQIDQNMPQIRVKNTLKALGDIASYVRDNSAKTKVIALTGSSGKTTVKEMTAAILSQKGSTLATKGNFNNDIGVPLTLLNLTGNDDFAVIELGANHLGEIAYTAKITKPHIALINNVYPAHLSGFGSLDGVIKAKGEIFEANELEVAILPLDYIKYYKPLLLQHKKVVTFSLTDKSADFYASQIDQQLSFKLHTPIGSDFINLPLLGEHNITNAIAAAALAINAGTSLDDVKSGLAKIEPIKGRLYPIKLNNDQIIIDDSYNANVGSMKTAIDVLDKQAGYRVFVVGDMAELGENSRLHHQDVGQYLLSKNIDCVISVGTESESISHLHHSGKHFQTKDEAVTCLKQILALKKVCSILVKGSRSAKMEQIIESIK